ncbi:MAG: formimidoylglutamate deiminase [Candidatus Dormibacteraceae bacterium]
MNGSGVWHAEEAWLGHRAENVVIRVEGGQIKSIEEGAPVPVGATVLKGWTIPGLANVHSHAFQRLLRGRAERADGDFWQWRQQMYKVASGWTRLDYFDHCRWVFREMLKAGITAVGEFHYLHQLGNELGRAVIEAAKKEGVRVTLIDACYLHGGVDGRTPDEVQQTFSDGDAVSWARRMDELHDSDGVRIAAAIHSVRAVDSASMRVVASYARERGMPLHLHLAEQPAEVEACQRVERCSPTQLLEREGVLGPDVTAVHAIHCDEADIAILGRHQATICACTTSERDLGDRVGPLRALADAGCPLSVGSDSNAVIDILEEARGFELDQRRDTGRRVLHQPEDLLRAATSNGMRALGWDAGELRPGGLADFITVAGDSNLDIGYLVFALGARDVTNVVVGGTSVVPK